MKCQILRHNATGAYKVKYLAEGWRDAFEVGPFWELHDAQAAAFYRLALDREYGLPEGETWTEVEVVEP